MSSSNHGQVGGTTNGSSNTAHNLRQAHPLQITTTPGPAANNSPDQLSSVDDVLGFVAALDNRLEVIENAMTVHHDHRAMVQSILTGHGLSKIRLPILDQPLPSLRYLGLNFDLSAIANTGAIPAAGPPAARPYHLTSTVVDVLFLSIQELAKRIDSLTGQMSRAVTRSDRLDWRLDRLALQLDRLHTQDLGDEAPVSRTRTAERTQRSSQAVAALRDELRQEIQSIRAQEDGKNGSFPSHTLSLNPSISEGDPGHHGIHTPPQLTRQPDDVLLTPKSTSLPPNPFAAGAHAPRTPPPPAGLAAAQSRTLPSPTDSPNLIIMSPPAPHQSTTQIPPANPTPTPSPYLNPLASTFNPVSAPKLLATAFNPVSAPPHAPATQPGPPKTWHSVWSSELGALEKFAALHSGDFSSAVRAHYKSRRKQLVENLDSLKAGPAPPHLPAVNWEPPKTLHSLLASELTALDKSAAARLRKFSTAEMAQNTSRRKQLVEQLDSLRVITKDFSWPNNKPAHGTQAVPSASHISQTDGGAPTTVAPSPKIKEEEEDSDPDIPPSEVAEALTNAFAIATRGMRFQTLGESRFAPKATATTYSKSNSAAAASAPSIRATAWTLSNSHSTAPARAPAPGNTPAGENSTLVPTAVSEEERARLFRERVRGRGIVVGGVKKVGGDKNVIGWEFEGGKKPTRDTTTTTPPTTRGKSDKGEEQGVYASLGLFEEVVGSRQQDGAGGNNGERKEGKGKEREVLGREQKEEGKGKGKEKEVLSNVEEDKDDPKQSAEEKKKAWPPS
ncbi:MAG: hypothetical protein Q9173_002105 [Seirophora scorigena]